MKKTAFKRSNPQIAQYDHHQDSNQKLVFANLQELLKFLNQFDTSNCYFRGQSGLWNIVSSLFRHSGTARFEKAQNMCVAAVGLLKENKHIFNAVQNNDNYALAIAQHYGCPTDLVDITTSLRVAGYFAASPNNFHQEQPEGCIWVFPESEILFMQETLPAFLEDNDSVSEYIIKALDKNKGSLLLKPDILQLSRLNAQKGAFLWDMGGILNELIHICDVGACFVFKHTSNEKDEFSEDECALFPLPNELESEIMRIFTEQSREDGLPEYIGPITSRLNEYMGVSKQGVPKALADRSKNYTELPMPDYFTPSFGEYPWAHRMITCNNVKPNNIDMEQFIQCYLRFDLDGIQDFVKHILTCLESEDLTDYLVFLIDTDKKILYTIEDTRYMVNIVINLNNYTYSQEEIAKVLLEYLRMTVFKQQKQFNPTTNEELEAALIFGQIDNLVKEYYGCSVTKLNLHETGGHISFWLPENYLFLDSAYLEEFENFDKQCFTPPDFLLDVLKDIPDNARIFLYQHKPQKIISYKCMREMFIRLVIPQLFAFRPPSERLYIPDHIKGITLPYFGRPLFFW